MVPNTNRLLERYIEGLPLNIKGNVTSSKPVDLHEAIEMAQGLMYQVVQELGENSGDKRKWNGNHYNNSNAQKRQECSQSDKVCMLENYHSTGNVVDTTLMHALLLAINVEGQGIKPKNAELHLVLQAKEDPKPKEDWVVMLPASDAVKRGITITSVQTMETKSVVIKFEVISTNLKTVKSKETLEETTKTQRATKEEASTWHGIPFVCRICCIGQQSCQCIYIDVTPTTLDAIYYVELADGKSLTTNTILRGCTLKLQNHSFNIDLLPIELGSFDVIIGMDWMSKHHAEVVCHEKYIRIPYRNEVLVIRGERSRVRNESRLEVISSIKTQNNTPSD
ncbi:putative reverse transcriptase domain-containing protein [Tanacetum coccineum]